MEREKIQQKVFEIVSDKLGVEISEISKEKSFSDLSADSLDRVELVMELEKGFSITIPDDQMEKINTVGEAINVIEEKLKIKV